MKLDKTNTEKVAKLYEHDVFETKKRKCNNDKYSKLCGILEHEELKQKKKKKAA